MLDEALRTAVALLAVIPDVLFSGSEETSSGDGIESVLKLAYGDTVKVEQASSEIRQHVAPGIVASVFKASETASEAGWQPDALLHVARLNQLLIDREVPPLSKVDSQKWANAVLGRLSKVRSFAVVDVLVDSALKASRSKLFVPPIDLSSGAVMTPVLDAVSSFGETWLTGSFSAICDPMLLHTMHVQLSSCGNTTGWLRFTLLKA